MKGIMIKELYLSKKNHIIGSITYMITFIMCVLVKLSIIYGNLGKLPAKTVEITEKVMYYILPIMQALILYGTLLSNNSKADERSKWRRYAHTLPLTERQILSSSYLYNALGFIAATIINFLVYFLSIAMFGGKFQSQMLFIILGLGSVTYIAGCYSRWIIILTKGKKKSQSILAITAMALYFGICFLALHLMTKFFEVRGYENYLNSDEDLPPEVQAEFDKYVMDIGYTIKDNLWWAVPSAIVVCVTLFYFLSIKALKRRDN